MCQATVYLDGEKILEDVLFVEQVEDGIRLVKLFEPMQFVQAQIRQIDLMKHKIILITSQESERNNE